MTMFFVLSKKLVSKAFQMEASYFDVEKDMSDIK